LLNSNPRYTRQLTQTEDDMDEDVLGAFTEVLTNELGVQVNENTLTKSTTLGELGLGREELEILTNHMNGLFAVRIRSIPDADCTLKEFITMVMEAANE